MLGATQYNRQRMKCTFLTYMLLLAFPASATEGELTPDAPALPQQKSDSTAPPLTEEQIQEGCPEELHLGAPRAETEILQLDAGEVGEIAGQTAIVQDAQDIVSSEIPEIADASEEVISPAPADDQAALIAQKEAEATGRRIFIGTQKLWLLLSPIDSKAEADAATAEFRALTRELIRLDIELSGFEYTHPDAIDVELNQNIIEAYRNIDVEFASLYRARCFGSTSLYQAFEDLKGTNFFDTSMLPPNQPVLPKLNAREENIELTRLKRLIAPDTAILDHLSQIADTQSAGSQCRAIKPYLQKLDTLRPDTKYLYRYFSNTKDKDFHATQAEIQRLLWNMRTEYVRIAALPIHPEEESHELLAHTLDELYYNLEVTHHYWFNVVFDSSFLLDMDEAFRQSEILFISQSR